MHRPTLLRLAGAGIGLGLLVATWGCGSTQQAASQSTEQPGQGEVALKITTAAGKNNDFIVQLAVTPQEQEHGLMGRKPLADNRGMLFPFAFPGMATFWMKDTPSPLDLIFIRPDGTISAILEGKPNDLHPLAASEPVSAVLEIRQGRAQALGIAQGDRVQWGDCASGAASPAGVWEANRFCPAGAR